MSEGGFPLAPGALAHSLRKLIGAVVVVVLPLVIMVGGGVLVRLKEGPNGQRRIFYPGSLRFENFNLYAFPLTKWVFHVRHAGRGEHPARRAAIKAGVSLDDPSPHAHVAYEAVGAEEDWTTLSWGYHCTVCAKCGYGDKVDELLRRMDQPETAVTAMPFLRRFVEALQHVDYEEAAVAIHEADRALHLSRR